MGARDAGTDPRLAAVEWATVTRQPRRRSRRQRPNHTIGSAGSCVRFGFARVAKCCYQPGNSVGVCELFRLISRISSGTAHSAFLDRHLGLPRGPRRRAPRRRPLAGPTSPPSPRHPIGRSRPPHPHRCRAWFTARSPSYRATRQRRPASPWARSFTSGSTAGAMTLRIRPTRSFSPRRPLPESSPTSEQ